MSHKRRFGHFPSDETSRRKRKKKYHIEEATDGLDKDTRTEPLKPKPPSNLAMNGLSKEDWKALEASQEKLPRFLFRAFGRKSGGNARLNKVTGIVPRGFLKGKKPTNIYDIPYLHGMICNHYQGGRRYNTEFSSWAACITIAIFTVNYGTCKEYVAIIDRTLLAPHVKIYHVPDLFENIGPKRCCRGFHEYLAYGPINGPALHCVSYRDIINNGYHSVAGHSYQIHSFSRPIFENVDNRVTTAKKLASLFRPSHDKRPDIIIALTAAFASLSFCGPGTTSSGIVNKELLESLLYYLHDELNTIKSPPAGYKQLALVNSNMYTYGFPQLQQMVALLGSIEDEIRNYK
ncbi:uncharacterized protein F4807DRAFT_471038 [Annulohypoxylon truncatum]|uniref:uncharacterized protein n=1 Tax=Annulohypoxylon truncatum TaxID=327061 RepID=UPI002007FF05|nr:uncharacterized protein F4807DRAFT_471038 [Annulohypoxylon truncatum]KAI1205493.1 hypothetical protein F4807DRAFT_471038 [Annulohypoxylon truncatum]